MTALTAVAFVTISFSCSESNENEPTPANDAAYLDLHRNIKQMSEEFLTKEDITPNTRNIFSRIWNAVSADTKAIVAISNKENELGNVTMNPNITIVSEVLTASKNAYKKLGGKNVSYLTLNQQNKFTVDSLLNVYHFDQNSFKLEKAHNTIILQLIKQGFNDGGYTQNTIAQSRYLLRSYGLPEPSHSAATAATVVDNYINNYFMYDFGGEGTTILLIKDMPDISCVLKTLDQYLGYAQTLFSPQQVKAYTTATIETVNQSAVDAEDCLLITQSLEMALASFDLWYNIELFDTDN